MVLREGKEQVRATRGRGRWYEYEDERSSTLSPECRVTRHDSASNVLARAIPLLLPFPFPSALT